MGDVNDENTHFCLANLCIFFSFHNPNSLFFCSLARTYFKRIFFNGIETLIYIRFTETELLKYIHLKNNVESLRKKSFQEFVRLVVQKEMRDQKRKIT